MEFIFLNIFFYGNALSKFSSTIYPQENLSLNTYIYAYKDKDVNVTNYSTRILISIYHCYATCFKILCIPITLFFFFIA